MFAAPDCSVRPLVLSQFIGDYSVAPDEQICVVARPFSGDVVGIDPATLKIRRSAKVGWQPLEVVALPGGTVVGA